MQIKAAESRQQAYIHTRLTVLSDDILTFYESWSKQLRIISNSGGDIDVESGACFLSSYTDGLENSNASAVVFRVSDLLLSVFCSMSS